MYLKYRIQSLLQRNTLFRDIILGAQDGLVNVLGIILGLTAANSSIRLIIAASAAACLAESISMGAVTYTSFNSQKDFYDSKKREQENEIENHPLVKKDEIKEIYVKKGFSGDILNQIIDKVTSKKEIWVDNLMGEEYHMYKSSSSDIIKSSLIVCMTSIIGSLVPIFPFLLPIPHSLTLSLILSSIFLFSIGAYKAYSMKINWIKSGLQILFIGLFAAFIGYGIGLFFRS